MSHMLDSDYVTASFSTLVESAPATAAQYLRAAKREIDQAFGEGYAAKNPILVAAFMQAAAADMSAATGSKVFGAALQEIARGLDGIAEALRNE